MAINQQLSILVVIVSCLCLLDTNATTTSTRRPLPARPVLDPAFVNAGSQPGLLVWRIERFNPVAVPANKHGKFHIGDSYLVLYTFPNKRSWDIHTWIGNGTSNDEAATAAFKMTELDNLLGGGPIQHREDQGEESDKFKAYFTNGIEYLPGGVPSGLRHVEPPR